MSTLRRVLLGGAALVVMSCMQLPLHGESAPPPPANPPAGRGQDCVMPGSSCQSGLTCVQFTSTIGNQATCEIPCGAGCPDGMTCGTRHDLITGPGAANVCL